MAITDDPNDWRAPLVRYLQGERMGSLKELTKMEWKARFYYLIGHVLYRKTFLPIDARYLSKEEGMMVLREAHGGGCSEHAEARSLARKVVRSGFYWPTMKEDAIDLVWKCVVCQKHGPLIHVPATDIISIGSSCPFAQWGIDIVGLFVKASGQRRFFVVAVDYFTKWVEAEPLTRITEGKIMKFIWKNICCRFGLSRVLVSDNGTQFKGETITSWCEQM